VCRFDLWCGCGIMVVSKIKSGAWAPVGVLKMSKKMEMTVMATYNGGWIVFYRWRRLDGSLQELRVEASGTYMQVFGPHGFGSEGWIGTHALSVEGGERFTKRRVLRKAAYEACKAYGLDEAAHLV